MKRIGMCITTVCSRMYIIDASAGAIASAGTARSAAQRANT